MRLGWFDFRKFDIAEYEHYEKMENGDLNWVIPGKLLAFSSPYDSGKDDSGVEMPTFRTCCSRPRTMCLFSRNWEWVQWCDSTTRHTIVPISKKRIFATTNSTSPMAPVPPKQ